jgi:Glycosyltransferase family 87
VTVVAVARSSSARNARLAKASTELLLAILPVVMIPALAVGLLRSHNFAFDFHIWYWPAANRVLDGLSPYALPVEGAFKYPAVAALLIAPFALLPHAFADWTFTLLVIAAVPATLRLLNVRDWRVYAIALLWPPVVYGWETANVTLLLMLGVALVWRYRDRAKIVGAVLALLVSVKLFLLPLVVWLLATRRYAALAWTILATAVLNAIAWPVLGMHALAQYVHLLHGFTPGAERRGYSLISLLLNQGIGQTPAYVLALALAAVAAAAGIVAGRHENDIGAITACLVASLLASPLVESHYLALLIVPLAMAYPRLSIVWSLPLVLWIAPVDHPANWQRLVALCIGSVVVVACLQNAAQARKVRALSRTFV